MELCLVKVGKSDACIRPLFPNSVTFKEVLQSVATKLQVLVRYESLKVTSSVLGELFKCYAGNLIARQSNR